MDKVKEKFNTKRTGGEQICTSKPVMIDRNCNFVVNIQCLKEIDDIFADDCGAWIRTGSPKYYVEEKRSKGSASLKRVGRGSDVTVKRMLTLNDRV